MLGIHLQIVHYFVIEIGIAQHKVQESCSWNDDVNLFCIGFHHLMIGF